ncbi:GNAT family N-acetyltransferase, partial [Cronobacter dublinensis subsp. dublinensis]|nr:GNAT family N-acetyltransferase [Cronobacter dublinensis subsp. dublinensis]
GQEDAVCFARDLQDAARHAERA